MCNFILDNANTLDAQTLVGGGTAGGIVSATKGEQHSTKVALSSSFLHKSKAVKPNDVLKIRIKYIFILGSCP